MSETIPLFPLPSVLFPGGEIALQLFEPRYLDMTKRCMREDTGFGVVAIRAGSEVADTSGTLQLFEIGTHARVVDWDALENGRLGIIARGDDKFRILSTTVQPDHLVVAEVQLLPVEPSPAMPAQHEQLVEILKELMKHPSVARMQPNLDTENAAQVANLLGQLLPIDIQEKYALLCCADPLQRLERIAAIIAELSGNR